jgi:hypothetical protein
MTAVVAIDVVAPVAAWEAVGLSMTNGVASVGGIELRFRDPVPGEAPRVDRWVLAGCPTAVDRIDGLATAHEEAASVNHVPNALGAVAFDHLVVMTSSLERTCGEIERLTGEPLKRIREAGPIRQGFHRLGSLIIEVVETAQVTASEASFWGFVLNIDDLEGVAERLGPDVLSPPKQAVQKGRLISTVRTSAGLGLPTALMTP